ncbi:MAG: Nif11-like leader peptide family natural product precursor [Nitrospirae bacterium YQR-1]
MSVESAKEFIEKLSSDMVFRNKVEAVKDKSARAKMVKDAGFDFTMAELKQVVPDTYHSSFSGELSENDLEKIAGGMSAETAAAIAGA